MRAIENFSAVTDYSAEPPQTVYSNNVCTVINEPRETRWFPRYICVCRRICPPCGCCNPCCFPLCNCCFPYGF